MCIFAEINIKNMDRKQFSELLVKQREQNNIGKNEMCRLTGFTFVQLQLLEVRPNNFAIKKAIDYLAALHKVIVIYNHRNETTINNVEKFNKWLVNKRKKIPIRTLAEMAGCSFSAISHAEQGISVISIDVFLKIIEALGYEIKIKSV
jgi:transcriptional regulator with XRE-family HTH domain